MKIDILHLTHNHDEKISDEDNSIVVVKVDKIDSLRT